MTEQETFDTVVLALLKQNRRSVDETGAQCRYRGKNGLKCAVGHLIPDELYDTSIEGQVACILRVASLLHDLGHSSGLCADLQIIHDKHEPAYWAIEFRALTKERGLSAKVIDEFEARQETKG